MSVLPKWWRTNFLLIELFVALLLTLMIVGWTECLNGLIEIEQLLAGNRGTLYGTLASIFGSLLGFSITAASIILGFSSSERLRVVRNSKHFPTVWKVFSSTIRTLGLATVISLVGLLADREITPIYVIFYLLVFSFLLSVFRIARTIWILENIIGILTRSVQMDEEP